jgi:signal transduction histidine kinase
MPANPMVSEGTLSWKPWTDPAHGPGPVRTVTVYPGEFSYAAVMIYSLETEQARLNTIIWALAAATLGITALIAGSTWIAAGRVLRPVEAIRAEFAELSTHHLDQRVTVPRTGNEIARLATTMNTTLDNLQTAVVRQRQFTADASHELRTPLACLRTELELALSRPDDADWPRVVHAAHEDTVRIQELTEDLLLLARLDAEDGDRRPRRSVDLTDLVREETARRRPPRDLRLHVHAGPGPVTVQGHPALLARVIGNLLDNAERHATHIIDVRLTHDTHRREALVEVLDDGPGIPVDDRQRVFERFTRLDDARARNTGGAGLGLAIAHHITTTHQGALDIVPSPRGAHFALRLPTPAPCDGPRR